ncbi:MAG TPA: porin [Candidatus Eisenbacteria bacterium]|nr:porin [Candidatus Eisenbacteria bacterium]
MKGRRSDARARSVVGAGLVLAVLMAAPNVARCGVKVFETEGHTLELGFRLQPRMELDHVLVGGITDGQRDFMIRRARFKANGKMKTASYGFEWKIDQTDQNGITPSAAVENAWIQFVLGGGVEMRAGLYDQPFSRDRLTSDSKQLAVDRGDVSGVPDGLGLADNATGFQLMGKGYQGRTPWAVGLFDNRRIAGRYQDRPMVVGRLDVNFGSTKDVFQDAHFGTDRWYSLGVNGSFQQIENVANTDSAAYSAVGGDGMLDVPVGAGRLFVKGEANVVKVDPSGAGPSIETKVWMVGAGFLVLQERLQPFARFDETRFDTAVGGGKRDVTYVGMNYYLKGHSLKLQGDVRLQANTSESVDGARLQAQMDF